MRRKQQKELLAEIAKLPDKLGKLSPNEHGVIVFDTPRRIYVHPEDEGTIVVDRVKSVSCLPPAAD